MVVNVVLHAPDCFYFPGFFYLVVNGMFLTLGLKQGLAKKSRHDMNTQMPAGSDLASKVLAEMEADETKSFKDGSHNSIELPSNLQPNQVCKLQFRKDDNPLTATVRGVHFYIGKVKYDLGLWLGDGSVDNPETETRIYNVDSVFVYPA